MLGISFAFDPPFNLSYCLETPASFICHLCNHYFAGSLDPMLLLEQTDLQIANAKEEAFSRREILEKVEKWFAACGEECWLEEYNRVNNFFVSLKNVKFRPFVSNLVLLCQISSYIVGILG